MNFDRVIPEPRLEFGNGGTSCDIRDGIAEHGPVDFGTVRATTEVRIGLVGTAKTVAEFSDWMKNCASGIKGENPLNQNHRHPISI